TDGPHRERCGGCEDDRFLGDPKLLGKCVVQKHDYKKVERVQRPAEKPRQDRMMRSRFLGGSRHVRRYAIRQALALGDTMPHHSPGTPTQKSAPGPFARSRTARCYKAWCRQTRSPAASSENCAANRAWLRSNRSPARWDAIRERRVA